MPTFNDLQLPGHIKAMLPDEFQRTAKQIASLVQVNEIGAAKDLWERTLSHPQMSSLQAISLRDAIKFYNGE